MNGQQHIIMRQVLDVKIKSGQNHSSIQDELSRIYRNRLVPLLESYLNENSVADAVQKVESLELDLGKISLENLEEELIHELEQCLKTKLATKLKEQSLGSFPLDPGNIDLELQKSILEANRKADEAFQQARDAAQNKTNTPNSLAGGSGALEAAIREANEQADRTQASTPNPDPNEDRGLSITFGELPGEDQQNQALLQELLKGRQKDERTESPTSSSSGISNAENASHKNDYANQEQTSGLNINFSKMGKPIDSETALNLLQAQDATDPHSTWNSSKTNEAAERDTALNSADLQDASLSQTVANIARLDQPINEQAQSQTKQTNQTNKIQKTFPQVPKQYELMIFFLQKGIFPWWAPENNYEYLSNYFLSLFERNQSYFLTILANLSSDPEILKRYIHAMTDEFHLSLAKNIQTEKSVQLKKQYQNLLDLLRTYHSEQELRQSWWKNTYELLFKQELSIQQKLDKNHLISLVVKTLSTKKYEQLPVLSKLDFQQKLCKLLLNLVQLCSWDAFEKELKALAKKIGVDRKNPTEKLLPLLEENRELILKKLVETKTNLAALEQEKISTKKPKIDEKMFHTFNNSDKIYIQNAGIVLFWPYLMRFFENLAYVNEREFKDEQAREKACIILQYLADESTSKSDLTEAQLPLNKVLCGIDLETPIFTHHQLSKKEIKLAKELINAVLQNAPIWKNLSIQGFQTSYMLREAALSTRDGIWLLQVKRETFDVLLDKLPWSINQIKLPWMNKLLTVEWQK